MFRVNHIFWKLLGEGGNLGNSTSTGGLCRLNHSCLPNCEVHIEADESNRCPVYSGSSWGVKLGLDGFVSSPPVAQRSQLGFKNDGACSTLLFSDKFQSRLDIEVGIRYEIRVVIITYIPEV